MEEAKAIIAGTNTPPSVATVGTDGASAPEGATEGEPKAPVGPTLVQPDPETSPPEGDKPAWMP